MDWRTAPSLAALRAFEAAARTGSLTAAARELNVTHAAIAQHMRALEAHFGRPVMAREGRRAVPTSEGATLAAALSDGFGTILAASADLLDAGKDRPLRIGLTPSFAENWLMPRIGRLWSAHPDLEVELIPAMALADLRRDGLDLAIRYGRGDWTGLQSEPLTPATHVVIAAPDHPAANGAGWEGARWLMNAHRSEEVLWAKTLGIDLTGPGVTEVASASAVLHGVMAGHALSVVPRPIVSGDIAGGRLVALAEQTDGDDAVAYHLVTRPGHLPPRLRTFLRWIRAEVRAAP